MINNRWQRWAFDGVLALMFVLCVGLTWRSCRERPTDTPLPVADASSTDPAATPAPTPEPIDDNPKRTLILTAMAFFENIANKRYDEAAAMFLDPAKQDQWRNNLTRLAEVGNPMVAFEIEKPFERSYCGVDLKDETKARCDFPILFFRRDADEHEWNAVGMNLEKRNGRWWIVYYRQDKLDKAEYDKRKAEEERKHQAAMEAREKLGTGEVEETPPPFASGGAEEPITD
ncbi:MAG: hypothetical protein H6684_16325 [Deltaproteobacteria bacterium]|nr:hypothetical protein [Deltaproteobacteria bacterium]MCB9490299.1 hypothetical protein [Deltaproteobacteria bacterium]